MLKYEQCEPFRNELERSRDMFIVEDETARCRGREADTWGSCAGTSTWDRICWGVC